MQTFNPIFIQELLDHAADRERAAQAVLARDYRSPGPAQQEAKKRSS